MLLVGTNNHGFPPEQIADGVMANVSAIRRLQPQAFIVVMVTETRAGGTQVRAGIPGTGAQAGVCHWVN